VNHGAAVDSCITATRNSKVFMTCKATFCWSKKKSWRCYFVV